MLTGAAPVVAAPPGPVAPARAAFSPPAHTLLSPDNNATGVAPDASLRIGFDQPVTKGTGFIRVYRPDGSERLPAVDVGTDAVTLAETGQEATIPLPAALLPGETVYLNVDAGTFVNATAEPFPGIAGTDAWRFTVNQAPEVGAFLPLNGSSNVPVGSALQLTFTEPVRKGTGNITLFEGATAVMTIGVNSGAVSVSGSTVIITPLVSLPSGATLSVQMPAGTFTDLTNIPYAGIADAMTWAFSVADATVPVVTALSPADGAAGVGLGTDLVLTFSEPVRKGSGNLIITHGSTSQSIPVGGASVFVPGGLSSTVTIDPADFPAGAAVAVTIPATAFADESGNPFAGTTGSGGASPWRFSTDDAPAISTLSPVNGAAGVAANAELVLTFSETVRKGSGSITLYRDATPLQTLDVTGAAVSVSGNRVTIRPGALPSGANVNVQMPAGVFTDLAGIPFAGIAGAAGWAFAVADGAAPVVTALSPANGATGVGVGAPLSITFNEPIRKGSGTITIYQGSSPLQTLAVTGPAVSVSGNTAFITPSSPFPSEAALFVIVPGRGLYRRVPTNAFAGINDPSSWSFRVADVTDPVGEHSRRPTGPPGVAERQPGADVSTNR
jgi:methionine-rich copper-binding protein CopC